MRLVRDMDHARVIVQSAAGADESDFLPPGGLGTICVALCLIAEDQEERLKRIESAVFGAETQPCKGQFTLEDVAKLKRNGASQSLIDRAQALVDKGA